MFYTNKSIRLHSVCLNYLDLIQQANNRSEDKRSLLARYDACNDYYNPIRLMNTRHKIVEMKDRYESLSKWLVHRYQDVYYKLSEENLKQLRKEITGSHPLTAHLVNPTL